MLQYYFNPRVSRCLIQVSSQHQISNYCYEVNFFTTSRAEVKIGLLQQNDIFYPPGGYIVPFGGGGGAGGAAKECESLQVKEISTSQTFSLF